MNTSPDVRQNDSDNVRVLAAEIVREMNNYARRKLSGGEDGFKDIRVFSFTDRKVVFTPKGPRGQAKPRMDDVRSGKLGWSIGTLLRSGRSEVLVDKDGRGYIASFGQNTRLESLKLATVALLNTLSFGQLEEIRTLISKAR